MDTKQRFANAMKTASMAMDKPLDAERIRIYWNYLSEYPIEDVESAFSHCIKRNNWFPKIAELIELMAPKDETPDQEAIREWDRAVLLLRDSRNAVSQNPIAERVVSDLGGWLSLGRKTTDELVWVQKEFVRRYVSGVETNIAPIRRVGSGRIDALISDHSRTLK